MSETIFADRAEAGRRLAREVLALKLEAPLVIALPRGGVPVAAEVARALKVPLDLLLVRKVGAPGNPELAVGAIADGTPPVLVADERLMELTGADARWVEREAAREQRENERRRVAYLAGRTRPPLAGRTVVVVDDGLATGTTMRAALQALRQQGAARLVMAVPVAPPETIERFRSLADDIVCPLRPPWFQAVGVHYRDFHQVDDAEVVAALDAARLSPTR